MHKHQLAIIVNVGYCTYFSYMFKQALTPPIRLYPPNAGPILPGMLGAAALGAQANVAAVAAGASAAAIQAAYDSSSKDSTLRRCTLLKWERWARRSANLSFLDVLLTLHVLTCSVAVMHDHK